MGNNCFLCGYPNIKTEPGYNHYFTRYDCPVCGEYQILSDVGENFRLTNGNIIDKNDFHLRASSVAAELKLAGMDRFILCDDGDSEGMHQQINKSKFKQTHNFYFIGVKAFLDKYPAKVEIYDRILLNLLRLIKSHYGEYELKKIPAEYIGECAYFYCSKFEQVKKICNFLKVSGEIDYAHTKNDEEKITISITPQGWKKIAILEDSKSFEDSDKAFLAMWFNEATDAYRDAVKTAVAEAGYSTEEMIADEARHNDFIMNKVLNMINDAKFVIADFTCAPEENNTDRVKNGVRGGVYFEAGYARGQGKQVIHTSKEDDESRKRIHFDIAQINTIYWNTGDGNQLKDEKDFIDRLKNAIIATVGKGPGG